MFAIALEQFQSGIDSFLSRIWKSDELLRSNMWTWRWPLLDTQLGQGPPLVVCVLAILLCFSNIVFYEPFLAPWSLINFKCILSSYLNSSSHRKKKIIYAHARKTQPFYFQKFSIIFQRRYTNSMGIWVKQSTHYCFDETGDLHSWQSQYRYRYPYFLSLIDYFYSGLSRNKPHLWNIG